MKKQNYKNTSVSIYNTNQIDFTKEKLFFGAGKNSQRFDVLKYPFLDNSNDNQQGFDWKHDEVSLVQDVKDYKTTTTIPQDWVITKTFQKLIFLDSAQGRGPVIILGQIATLPELENVINVWQYFEGNKHSRTYTEILRAIYNNPDEIFNESFNIDELNNIVIGISNVYEDTYQKVIEYIYKTQKGKEPSKELIEFYKEELSKNNISEDLINDLVQAYIKTYQKDMEFTPKKLHTLKKAILSVLFEINALEGIRFYTSFAAIWAMNKSQSLFPGISENLQFICRDENEHLALTQNLIKYLRKNEDEEFIEAYNEIKHNLEDRYYEIYFEEVEWVKFLFSKGSYIGMNEDILLNYLNYITIRRMKSLGINPTKEKLGNRYVTKNPLPWVDKYINMDKNEKLPQQENVLNYVTGGVEQDMSSPNDIINIINKYIKE